MSETSCQTSLSSTFWSKPFDQKESIGMLFIPKRHKGLQFLGHLLRQSYLRSSSRLEDISRMWWQIIDEEAGFLYENTDRRKMTLKTNDLLEKLFDWIAILWENVKRICRLFAMDLSNRFIYQWLDLYTKLSYKLTTLSKIFNCFRTEIFPFCNATK